MAYDPSEIFTQTGLRQLTRSGVINKDIIVKGEHLKVLYGVEKIKGFLGISDSALESLGDLKEITGDPIYTSIVVDLIDNKNQRNTTGGGSTNIPLDRVTGYTIRQIEQSLKGATSWNQWRDNLRNQHTNGTENNLNELFANWH